MRAVGHLGGATEPHPLIEPGRRGILRAQAQMLERLAGGADDLVDELPAHAEMSIRYEHVEVAYPADARRRGVGIDVEAADADHSPAHRGHKERLAGTVESIRPSGRGALCGLDARANGRRL